MSTSRQVLALALLLPIAYCACPLITGRGVVAGPAALAELWPLVIACVLPGLYSAVCRDIFERSSR